MYRTKKYDEENVYKNINDTINEIFLEVCEDLLIEDFPLELNQLTYYTFT